MADLERDLRDLLERQSAQASAAHAAQNDVVTRSIRRRVAIPFVAALVVIALGSSVVAAGGPPWLNEKTQPAQPSPSTTSFDNPGSYVLGDDPSTDKEIEVARGERGGIDWRLYAYREKDGDLCTGSEWGGDTGMGCGNRPNRHDINIGLSSAGDEQETLLEGDLSVDVAAVEVRLEGEDPFRVPVFPDPASFGVNFFLAFLPNNPRGEVVALDADGNTLEIRSITEIAGFMGLSCESPESQDQGVLQLHRAQQELVKKHARATGSRKKELQEALDETIEALEEDSPVSSFEECTSDAPVQPQPGPDACLGDPATIIGTEGPDVLEGTPGADVIHALGGDDVITGFGGGDSICGGEGDDRIVGAAGDDEIWGGPGNDSLSGDGGFDSVVYWESESAVTVDLSSGTASGEGDDSLSGFEELGGSKHDDVLIGTRADDQIQGGEGNDRVVGLGGDDVIYPDLGDDEVDGGLGQDFMGFSLDITGPVTVDLSEGVATGEGSDLVASIEIVHGTKFDDVLIGSAAAESLSGREGSDRIEGGGGDDELWGEFPRFTAAAHKRTGPQITSADDQIDGGAGHDKIGGGPGQNICDNGEDTTDC